MYKAIVVDDELAARETLKKYCKVYAADFEVIQSFSNGSDAIKYLSCNDVDVVFTDIKMPGISGIDIAKWISENKSYIKVIMVSGYGDFEYAQQAIRYRVFDYLLKVININEFINVIDKLRQELLKSAFSEKTEELEIFFYNMLCGMFPTDEKMKEAFSKCSRIPTDEAVCKDIIVRFNDLNGFLNSKWHYDYDLFKYAITNVIKEMHNRCFTMITYDDNDEYKFILLMSNKFAVNIDSETVRAVLNDNLDIDVEINVDEAKGLMDFFNNHNNLLVSSKEKEKLCNSLDIENEDSKEKHIEKVIQYIKQNYDKGIMAKDVADYFYMNVTYLGRQFKEITGKSIIDYILDMRMNKAIELIKQGESLVNVCTMVGYKDKRNFRRLFQRYTGMTVQEYRESLKKE
ncbi:MAG: response regulator [Clostridia bacterium]|nr:response regulator [Clostridia bacterium]